MYKNFKQFLFEASEHAEERKKEKDMIDKLKDAKKASVDAKENLNKIEDKKDVPADELKKAKLTADKAEATVTQVAADIQLKQLEDKAESKKKD